ncbi:hypothetical protein KC333_g8 [Hortaea werneckii]|nr:hypothetical protein KC333_g8 [Hortaea werneckii]
MVRVSGLSSLANKLEVLSALAATVIYLVPLAGGSSALMLDKPVGWMVSTGPMLAEGVKSKITYQARTYAINRCSRTRESNHRWECLRRTSIGRKASARRERGLIKDIAELSEEKPAPGAVNSCNAFRCSSGRLRLLSPDTAWAATTKWRGEGEEGTLTICLPTLHMRVSLCLLRLTFKSPHTGFCRRRSKKSSTFKAKTRRMRALPSKRRLGSFSVARYEIVTFGGKLTTYRAARRILDRTVLADDLQFGVTVDMLGMLPLT